MIPQAIHKPLIFYTMINPEEEDYERMRNRIIDPSKAQSAGLPPFLANRAFCLSKKGLGFLERGVNPTAELYKFLSTLKPDGWYYTNNVFDWDGYLDSPVHTLATAANGRFVMIKDVNQIPSGGGDGTLPDAPPQQHDVTGF